MACAWLLSAAVLCVSCEGLQAYHDLKRSLEVPAHNPPARLELHDGLAVLHVYGAPTEMGTQYGTLLRAPLRALHTFAVDFTSDRFYDHCIEYGRSHAHNLPAPIRDELHAVANASGVPYDELVALNVIPRMYCSTLAVWDPTGGSHPRLLMGRNSDYFSLGLDDRGGLVVVHHPREGLAVASVGFVGMIGAYTGMNQKGVSFGNMLVFNAAGPSTNDDGLNIQLAQRLAAERSDTAAEMIDQLRGMAHAIPMNVMAADAQQALVVELGLDQVAVRRGDDGVLAAANHFCTPDLASHGVVATRYNTLLRAGRNYRAAGGITVPQMERALFDARFEGLNIQAVVFEPGAGRMHVSINKSPASAGPYVQLDAVELFGPPQP
jgi:hypothetical protein